MRWNKIVIVIIVLMTIVLSSLFYVNMLLIEKYDFASGVDKIVSMTVKDRITEILVVQNFLKINISLSIVLLIIILFTKFASKKS